MPLGSWVAKEQNLDLKSLQVEIAATLSLDQYQGVESNERAGFQSIDVVVKVTANATAEVLQQWITVVKKRCPVHDNLINPTPITLKLVPNKVLAAVI